MQYKYLVGFLVFLLSWGFSFTQSGAFTPANADYTFPRSALKSQDTLAIKNYVRDYPHAFWLYSRIYNPVLVSNFTPFTNDSQRRMGAHLAKNAAFCYFLNRKCYGPDSLVVLDSTERSFFLQQSLDHLAAIVTTVEAFPNTDNYIFRSNELIDNLVAYDLLKGAGVPDSTLAIARAKLIEYAANLFHECNVDIIGLNFFSLHPNNHAIRVGAALAMAGIILNDVNEASPDRQAAIWFHTGMFNVNKMFWEGGGAMSLAGQVSGYAEGPHYFRYTMKHCLPLFKALKQFVPDTTFALTYKAVTTQVRHPWYDPRYEKLYEWATRIRLPNGTLPVLEDSFIDPTFPELAILQNPKYHWDVAFQYFRHFWSDNYEKQLTYSSDDLKIEYLSATTPFGADTFDLFQINQDVGHVIMRSSWEDTATYLHLYAKSGQMRENAKGHNQGDGTSFILSAKGHVLALDPGYVQWSLRAQVAGPDQHNLVLIDGLGPPGGATNSGADTDVSLFQEVDFTNADICEARSAYSNGTFSRRTLFMHRDYFLMSDQCKATASHEYSWRLHGFGLENGDSIRGWFQFDSLAREASWTREGVTLYAQVEAASGNPVFTKEINVHEQEYLITENHSTLVVKETGNNAAFLAFMFGGNTAPPPATALNVSGNAAFKINPPGFNDFAIASTNGTLTSVSSSQSGLAQDLQVKGTFTVWSETTSNAFSFFSTWENDEIRYGNNPYYISNHPMGFALEKTNSSRFDGYASDTGTVQLYIPFSPASVNGWGIDLWSYDALNGILSLHFWKETWFAIHQNFVAGLPRSLPGKEVALFPNPIRKGENGNLAFAPELVNQKMKLTFFNVEGKIMNAIEGLVQEKITLPLPFDAGIYFLVIQIENREALSKKIMILGE